MEFWIGFIVVGALTVGFFLGRRPAAPVKVEENLNLNLNLLKRRQAEQERRLNKLIEALYAQQKLIEHDQERIESIVRALSAHRN